MLDDILEFVKEMWTEFGTLSTELKITIVVIFLILMIKD